MTADDGRNDRFPVGMRVLAVDDDPTCLKLLESLLRKCDYQVTTTNQAITALKLLRKNKDKFDLVISDVHMPDMDGFKLLELVGLEMDLPVIMLSGNSDTKAVMKGITHGACDYLLKPVRIEELMNIWQHVVRRRKYDPKDHGHNGHRDGKEKLSEEGERGHAKVWPADLHSKLSRKRKEQNDEEEEDDDEDDDGDFVENVCGNEDSSNPKKPRVVWSVELHRKFVAAVNQLGLDKAVPKKILDVMNVEKLTRENVASHLQKYRLYLRRISNAANQQANVAATLGGEDIAYYLPMRSLNVLGDFRGLNGSGPFPKSTHAAFHASGAAGRLNSPVSIGFGGLPSSGLVPFGSQPQIPGNFVINLEKLQHPPQIDVQQGILLQGVPHSLELDQLQQKNLSYAIDDPTVNTVKQCQMINIGGFSSSAPVSVGFRNSVSKRPSTVLQGTQQSTFNGGHGKQSSSIASGQSYNEQFYIGGGVSCHMPDLSRVSETWQNAVPLDRFSSTALPMSSVTCSTTYLSPENALPGSQMEIGSYEPFFRDAHRATIHDVAMMEGEAKVSDGKSMDNNGGKIMNHASKQTLNDYPVFASCSNSFLPTNGTVVTGGPNLVQAIGSFSRNKSLESTDQLVVGGLYQMENSDIGKSTGGSQIENHMQSSKVQEGFTSNKSCSSFDDLLGVMIKREREDTLVDGDIAFDVYSLGACI